MKLRVLLVIGVVTGSLWAAAPAQASCETELGDMCKAISVTCDNVYRINPKVWAQTNCRNW